MKPLNGSTDFAGTVPASSRIIEIARTLEQSDRRFAVVDETGSAIGTIDRAGLMDVLLQDDRPPEPEKP